MGFGKGPSAQSPTAWQRTKLAVAAGANLIGFSTGTTYDAGTIGKYVKDYVASLAASSGATLVNWIQAGTGAVSLPIQTTLRETVSVTQFGAVAGGGSGDAATNAAAFLAALATGHNVYVPEGTFYIDSTLSIGYGQKMYGAGQYKTNIKYTGAETAVYLGDSALTSLIYNCELHDLTVFCTSRSSAVHPRSGVAGPVAVELQNAVYFDVSNVSTFGSGNPNSGVGADQVLYGVGLYLHDNTIIGRINHVSCRLWKYGRFYACDAGNQSRWTAAIVDGGQGELANCMRGIVVGDPTVALYTGVGVTFRDLSIQGCYTTGINVNAGDGTVIENCYFEGNANYDIAVGTPSGAPSPIGVKILKNSMNSEDIGTTAYGTFPYIAKVYVDHGVFTTIRDNNMSISTAIPLISLAANADTSNISGNRLNSAAAVTGRILDNGTNTITADNYPEAPRCAVGFETRLLSAATGTVSYTGLGFKPTSIEFYCAVDTVNDKSVGGAALTGSGYLNRCITTDSSGAQVSSNNCIRIIRSSAGNEQKAVLHSFDADGFTLDWTLVGAPPGNTLVINYIARR